MGSQWRDKGNGGNKRSKRENEGGWISTMWLRIDARRLTDSSDSSLSPGVALVLGITLTGIRPHFRWWTDGSIVACWHLCPKVQGLALSIIKYISSLCAIFFTSPVTICEAMMSRLRSCQKYGSGLSLSCSQDPVQTGALLLLAQCILQVSDLPSADEWQGMWSAGMEGRRRGGRVGAGAGQNNWFSKTAGTCSDGSARAARVPMGRMGFQLAVA
ncbi:unnamed protein product [Pleuronectes platessa]|uniref:Uncharacterized protein n=1 Tax=Pleuronectes platessa TaxID=8262 RepID=A0A9N7Z269_PLEPL|nr:unnamed protein product [Pleuronectes platessa]